MKQIKTTSLLVFMIFIMIGSLIFPGVMATENFIVNVISSQNTVLEPGTIYFGDIEAGTTNTIEPTFTLNNTGNLAANITAAFTTDVGGIYGLINTTHVIAGTNFSLQSAAQTYTPLGATVSGVMMVDDVPANTAEAWNAKLVIPAVQYAMVYTGTIQITFS